MHQDRTLRTRWRMTYCSIENETACTSWTWWERWQEENTRVNSLLGGGTWAGPARSTDYMYFTEEDKAEERDAGEDTVRGSTTLGRSIIVGVDRKTGGVHSHQVKCNGSDDPWIATRIATNIEELRYGGSRVVLKADQEVTIADVQRQVVAARLGLGKSRSNSRVDNAVQRVQGLIRTLKDALEKRLNTRIKSSDPIFAWMVEWSTGRITRYVTSRTSKTAHREARGQDAQASVAEFGRKIMYMTSKR